MVNRNRQVVLFILKNPPIRGTNRRPAQCHHPTNRKALPTRNSMFINFSWLGLFCRKHGLEVISKKPKNVRYVRGFGLLETEITCFQQQLSGNHCLLLV